MSASDARIVNAAMKSATTSNVLDQNSAVSTLLNYGKSQGNIKKWRKYAELIAGEGIGEGNMTMTQALAKADNKVEDMATWGSTDATDFKDFGGNKDTARQAIANKLYNGGKANAQTPAGTKVNPVAVVSEPNTTEPPPNKKRVSVDETKITETQTRRRGSRDNPYMPKTISDMDNIKPGDSFINPIDNRMYTFTGSK